MFKGAAVFFCLFNALSHKLTDLCRRVSLVRPFAPVAVCGSYARNLRPGPFAFCPTSGSRALICHMDLSPYHRHRGRLPRSIRSMQAPEKTAPLPHRQCSRQTEQRSKRQMSLCRKITFLRFRFFPSSPCQREKHVHRPGHHPEDWRRAASDHGRV